MPVSAGIKQQHCAGFVVGENDPIGGDAVDTLYQILNSTWLRRGAGATIVLAPTGRVLADGLSDVCGVLDAGPRHPARLSSVRLPKGPVHHA